MFQIAPKTHPKYLEHQKAISASDNLANNWAYRYATFF